jgi:AcrR family transcriptional regulator
MESRREQLLDAALGYCVKHGLANLSLRPLADEIGTSARLLIFHFKSKDDLVAAVLVELNKRLQTSFEEMKAAASPSAHPPLRRFWDWATSDEALPSLRLLYELQIVAVQNPDQYGRYLEKTSLDWLTVATASLSSKDADDTIPTLCIAVFDGLMIEFISTGDRARLTRALDAFVLMARASIEVDNGGGLAR